MRPSHATQVDFRPAVLYAGAASRIDRRCLCESDGHHVNDQENENQHLANAFTTDINVALGLDVARSIPS